MLRNVPSRICIKSFTEVISLSNQLDAEIQTFGYSSFRHLVESLTYLLISLLLSILCGCWFHISIHEEAVLIAKDMYNADQTRKEAERSYTVFKVNLIDVAGTTFS